VKQIVEIKENKIVKMENKSGVPSSQKKKTIEIKTCIGLIFEASPFYLLSPLYYGIDKVWMY
jgi:hypothetical protein